MKVVCVSVNNIVTTIHTVQVINMHSDSASLRSASISVSYLAVVASLDSSVVTSSIKDATESCFSKNGQELCLLLLQVNMQRI